MRIKDSTHAFTNFLKVEPTQEGMVKREQTVGGGQERAERRGERTLRREEIAERVRRGSKCETGVTLRREQRARRK